MDQYVLGLLLHKYMVLGKHRMKLMGVSYPSV